MKVRTLKKVLFDERLKKRTKENEENDQYLSFELSDLESDYSGSDGARQDRQARTESAVKEQASKLTIPLLGTMRQTL